MSALFEFSAMTDFRSIYCRSEDFSLSLINGKIIGGVHILRQLASLFWKNPKLHGTMVSTFTWEPRSHFMVYETGDFASLQIQTEEKKYFFPS